MYRNVSDTFFWSVMLKMKENISAGTVAKVTIRKRTGNRGRWVLPGR